MNYELNSNGQLRVVGLLIYASTTFTACYASTEEDVVSQVNGLASSKAVADAESAGYDHDAVAHMDADGNPYGQKVNVHATRRPEQSTKPSNRGVVGANEKLSRKLQDVASAAAAKGELLDVIVGAATEHRMKRLPQLERGMPRSAATNAAILEQRGQAIAAVASSRKAERGGLEGRLISRRGQITQEYTFGNAVRVKLPADQIELLQNDPDVLSIVLAEETTPPPNVQWGRTALNADIYRQFGYDGELLSLWVGLVDTGVRSSHQQFTATGGGSIDFERDCAYGDANCLNGGNANFNTLDPYHGHGTASANVIMGGISGWGTPFQGISAVTIDTFNTALHATMGGNSTAAVLTAIGQAVNVGDRIIVAVVQIQTNSTAPIAVAADDAFDTGSVVLGANGNVSQVSNVGSPGNARKAMGIGDYNAQSDTVSFQISGRVDGRFKPDVQMPSSMNSASSHTNGSGVGGTPSDSTQYPFYGGTSAATASSGGATGITYELYSFLGLGLEPGKIYAALLAGGDRNTPDATNGAGRFRLQEACGSWWSGVRTVTGSGNQDITVEVPAFRRNLQAAIWWPEEIGQTHSNVALRVFAPGSGTATSSTDATSVWQKVGLTGLTTAGNWTIRMDPSGTLVNPQVVYYAVQAPCDYSDYFADTFSNLNNWTETGEGDWNVESLHTSAGYPAGGSGSPAAHSDNCATECVLTSTPIDLTFAGNVTLELSRFVDVELDAGEYLRVELFNGSTWNQIYNWTHGSGDDDVWHREIRNISDYRGINNFQIRLRTKSSLITEHVHIDDIRVRSGRP